MESATFYTNPTTTPGHAEEGQYDNDAAADPPIDDFEPNFCDGWQGHLELGHSLNYFDRSSARAAQKLARGS
jgi:hypothetical protein